ncbi:MAG: hypothetical protein R3Y09_12650 [Clostridia bacterium]
MDTFVRTKVSATRRATAEKKGSTSGKWKKRKIKNWHTLTKILF